MKAAPISIFGVGPSAAVGRTAVTNSTGGDGNEGTSFPGEVVIDDRGATSVPGVFAAGDCTTVPFKQIVIAVGAGATASLSAFDHLIRTSAPAEELVTA